MAAFDPYQVLEVKQQPCLLLSVTVKQARIASKGWQIRDPDTYVTLTLNTAPEKREQRTSTVNKSRNPVWNETKQFAVDEDANNVLEICLMEDHLIDTKYSDPVKFDISLLKLSETHSASFAFSDAGDVDIDFLLEPDPKPALRFSMCLSDEEKKYLAQRTLRVFECLQKLLDAQDCPKTLDAVPRIAVLGSGGGFRAMIGFIGVMKALLESGILDCITYLVTLSGSAWCVSSLYADKQWPTERTIEELIDEMEKSVQTSYLNLFSRIYYYIDIVHEKSKRGQPVSFTDFFSAMLADQLMKDRLDSRLSEQREKLVGGRLPLPVYSAIHVKKEKTATEFNEWIEFTPYEIGIAKYGCFVKPELFGSKFFRGTLVHQYDELPLTFLQGMWGSAFSILVKQIAEMGQTEERALMTKLKSDLQLESRIRNSTFDNKSLDGVAESSRNKEESIWDSIRNSVLKESKLFNSAKGRAGMVFNFMRGLNCETPSNFCPYAPFTPSSTNAETFSWATSDDDTVDANSPRFTSQVKKMLVVDAGIHLNLPIPHVLREQRAVDLILLFDFSARETDDTPPFEELLLAQKWAAQHNVRFPPINADEYNRDGLKELYIFKDDDDPLCPIVMHFVLCNKTFREFKAPGRPREHQKEKEFADFNVYDNPDNEYSTFNFSYTELAYRRLWQLTEFNTLINIDRIRECVKIAIDRRIKRTQLSLPLLSPATGWTKQHRHRLLRHLSSCEDLEHSLNRSSSAITWNLQILTELTRASSASSASISIASDLDANQDKTEDEEIYASACEEIDYSR